MSTRAGLTPVGGGPDSSWPSLDDAVGALDFYVRRESDSVVVEWTPRGVEPSEGAQWYVQRSSSPYGPWERESPALAAATRAFRSDYAPRNLSNTRMIFYRVVLVEGETARAFGLLADWESDQEESFDTVAGVSWGSWSVPPSRAPGTVRSIRRRFTLYVKRRAGTPCLLYRPSWLSERNPAVVGNATGIHLQGFGRKDLTLGQDRVQAYDTPVRIWVSKGVGVPGVYGDPTTVHSLLQGVSIEAPFWPPLQPHDVLRMLDGQLFEIAVLNPITHLEHVLQYAGSMNELPRTHPVNHLPMPPGFLEVGRAPRKASGRVMHMEAYQKTLDRGQQSWVSVKPPGEVPDDT